MGRRKERRHAGHGGAGRRVKLDLFAEPSGDMGGSSPREEVRGEGDSKNDAALPNSPSSSDNRPHNPLLLLEQYSDDELDEGSGEEHNSATTEDASADGDSQAKRTIGKEIENIANDTGNDHFAQKDDQILIDKGFASPDYSQKLEVGGHLANVFDDLLGGTDTSEGVAYPTASNTQLLGDLSSDWKMVLHEESNQYYYWNITTGETSWEVPEILALETSTTMVEKAGLDIEGKNDARPSASKENTPLDTGHDVELFCEASRGEEKKDVCNDRLHLDFLEDEVGNREANVGRVTLLDDDSINNTRLDTGHETTTYLSLKLVNHCESMLERLNSVKSMECDVEGQDLKLKCLTELEIRLADIKALAFHGPSLLPFWLHQENQLKQLEATIDDVILRYLSLSTRGIETSPSRQEGDGIEIDSRRNEVLFPVVEIHSPEQMAGKSIPVSQNDGATNTLEHVVGYLPTSSVNHLEGKTESRSIEAQIESIIKADTQSGDDIDMEVEEGISTSISGAHVQVFPGHSYQSNALGDQESEQAFNPLPHIEQWVPPPPPDDEPLPPPPPDDEPFPPPPPDEPPPEPSYSLVSKPEAVQPYPYSEHYAMSYPGSGLEYYGQIQADGTYLYMQADGSQVAVAHLPQYYEAVANAYTVTQLGVNSVEPSSYYGLHTETLNDVPLAGGSVESFVATSLSVSGSRGIDSQTESASNLFVTSNVNGVKYGDGTAEPLLENSSAMNTVPISSSSGTTTIVAATAATSKLKSKASRGKKRSAAVASTVRPSKKVSNLVDKWKAVKEGLQEEEEEEAEDAYEILERKKRREIEEWRAQQLATGDAKANANFQPLGGDWRERVKRKRAQKMKESSQDVSKDGNQQPDLVELSKGLRSGWQAYWDESSKQIYYGNTLTSETSWSKPT